LNIELSGGFLVGTFGFPYSREWRDIARWFERLPNQDVDLVTNEKLQIAAFYLPSKVRYNYISRDFPGNVRGTTNGVYLLIIQRPQSWMDELWGWSVHEWHENLVPLHDFINDNGNTVASIYFLNQDQIDAEFH
jgi:hypothetical protein